MLTTAPGYTDEVMIGTGDLTCALTCTGWLATPCDLVLLNNCIIYCYYVCSIMQQRAVLYIYIVISMNMMQQIYYLIFCLTLSQCTVCHSQ